MLEPRYEAQVRLLLRCLPVMRDYREFALKGGTAINLFLQSLPRVSVDIDLAYLPIGPRDETLAEIGAKLAALGKELVERLPQVVVQPQLTEGQLVRLVVSSPEARVKIEPNTIFRGSVFPAEEAELCVEAQRLFQAYVRAQILHAADLYGGKLCAALDRQHPRDLFDVRLLLEGVGITPEIRRAFVVYLAGHNRPMHELLQPRLKDISPLYRTQFVGMARREVPLDELVALQSELPRMLREALDGDERAFLLSLKRGNPEWERLGIERLAQFPALQWKLVNIRRMDRVKHLDALRRLEKLLAH